MLLGLFLAAHLANHLAALGGGQHIAVMARWCHHRGPPSRRCCWPVAVQVLSGLAQVVRLARRRALSPGCRRAAGPTSRYSS